MKTLYFDFETHPIVDGAHPPEIVGMAWQIELGAKYGRQTVRYTDHLPEMARELSRVWCDPRAEIVGHGVGFDIAVACHRLGLPLPRARVHDTMVQAFLLNPLEKDLGLKVLAEKYLGVVPRERDRLRAWLLANVPEAKRAGSKWGKYIYRAPQSLIRPYARADVALTRRLFWRQGQLLRAIVPPASEPAGAMQTAYRRECDLIPLLVQMRLTGIALDRTALIDAECRWTVEHARLEEWLYQSLGEPRIKKLSTPQVMPRLLERKLITDPPLTAKGNYSFKDEALLASDLDREWLAVWRARQQRQKVLSTYVRPWLRLLDTNGDGRVHPEWIGTRGTEGGKIRGARTGRLSSKPNFQNIPKAMEVEGVLPPALEIGPPPTVRQFIVPGPGKVILQRDYAQQEFRVLAHYEQGDLLRRYKENPKLDVHDEVRLLIQQKAGLVLKRDPVKIVGFRILYGSGIAGLAAQLRVPYERAKELKTAYMKALRGIRTVQDRLAECERKKEPYYTWGGRRYYVERTVETHPATEWGPATTQERSWGYKALNYLIQGSSADCTKEAMLRYWRSGDRTGELVASIHDELWVEVDANRVVRQAEMAILEHAMESVEFGVRMLTDGVLCVNNMSEAKA